MHPIRRSLTGGAVAVITEAAIRELAAKKGHGAPITSCYLDIDGRRVARHKDLEHEVDVLLKAARARANGEASVQSDLRKIERLVRSGLDRSRVRGLAIFACSADDLWRVIELPVPVHTRVTINHVPAVGQLESVLREHEPIGVLMADRQRARMFVFELGELAERSELFDALPRDTGARGERDRGGDHPHAMEARTQQHLRNAASVAFEVWSQHPFEHLAIAAPDNLASQLESVLHPYLRKRLAGRLSVPVTADHAEVQAAAEAVEAGVERRREAAVVERLRSAATAGRRGCAGLPGVIEALAEHRVDTLVVSKGYAAPGWRCHGCDTLAAMGRRCRRCGAEMDEVDDVVEDVVEEALAQSCQVEICVGNADLDVMGRVGALLRY
jgi:peptide subunit release factor 1 (eRF1)